MKKKLLATLLLGTLAASTAYAEDPSSTTDTSGAYDVYDAGEVVVTANRTKARISDIPANVTLITQQEIERGNYKSVSDALKGANVNVVQKGFAAYPILNGDSRVLVMVDGKKVNWDHLMVSGDDNAVNVDQVAIGDVSRIEIVRGPNSSLYGERAVSGVINIITKRPKKGKITGTANLQFGTWGENRQGINVSGGDEKNALRVGIANERRHDYDYKNAYGEKRTFQNSDIRHRDYDVAFDHIMGDDRLRLDFSRHESRDGFGILLKDPRTGTPYYTSRYDTAETMYGVTYMFGSEKDGEGTFLRFYRNESTADSPFDTATAPSPYTHKLTRNTFEGQKLWTLNDDNTLIAGFLWSRDAMHEENIGSLDVSATTKALFFEDDWQLGKGYSVKFGSRLEHHEDFGSNVASHVSLNKKFGKNTHAYLSWGQAVNNPTLKMRYANSLYMVGNPDLEQEKSQTITLGTDTQISPKWSVSASLYKSKVKNALNWAWNGRTRYYNTDREDRRGLELTTRYQFDNRWGLRAAYSYASVDSTDANRGYLSTNTRPNGYNLGLSYTEGKWEADMDLNYVTGRSTERFTDSRYLTLDLGINYHITKNFKLYLKGLNLTDESYESIGYTTLGAYAMPSRHFILGGTYSF